MNDRMSDVIGIFFQKKGIMDDHRWLFIFDFRRLNLSTTVGFNGLKNNSKIICIEQEIFAYFITE